MFEFSDNPLECFASYLPAPEYSPNPEIKWKLLKKFKTRYYLPNYIEARMETGIPEEEYNEFWGPVGEYDYDPVISAQDENWERSNREFKRTEYYNPNINLGVRDSVLRENGNIHDHQVDEIIIFVTANLSPFILMISFLSSLSVYLFRFFRNSIFWSSLQLSNNWSAFIY